MNVSAKDGGTTRSLKFHESKPPAAVMVLRYHRCTALSPPEVPALGALAKRDRPGLEEVMAYTSISLMYQSVLVPVAQLSLFKPVKPYEPTEPVRPVMSTLSAQELSV
jgi:hypothetical protein